MANCEMCGKETKLKTVLVEGIEMEACDNCAKFGKVLQPKSEPMIRKPRVRTPIAREEEDLSIVSNYSSLIRRKREQLGLKQEQFAKKLAEKESIIAKLESGSFTPSIDMARRIERILHIKLVESTKEEKIDMPKSSGSALTIGDMIKIRKK